MTTPRGSSVLIMDDTNNELLAIPARDTASMMGKIHFNSYRYGFGVVVATIVVLSIVIAVTVSVGRNNSSSVVMSPSAKLNNNPSPNPTPTPPPPPNPTPTPPPNSTPNPSPAAPSHSVSSSAVSVAVVSSAAHATSTVSSSAVASTGAASGVTYEIEVGPYEVTADETSAYNKSNVTESQAGIPIQYDITIVSGTTVMSGVRLDFWAANAQGLYSGESAENTAGTDYMRGWQVSNTNGLVSIASIFSGPYAGRTNHIHFRVREYAADGATITYDDTTQLFFPAAITQTVMTSVAAYERTNANSWSTVNSNDRLYQAANEMTLTGSTATGYVATYTLRAPLTNCNDC